MAASGKNLETRDIVTHTQLAMVTGSRVVSVWAVGPWYKPPTHLEGISALANEVSWPLSCWSPLSLASKSKTGHVEPGLRAAGRKSAAW